MAASSYSTVRLKTQPEPHECILLCISHHTQILWWSEQFSSSNRGCSFACESCKTTQSHQWFFEPDGLCSVGASRSKAVWDRNLHLPSRSSFSSLLASLLSRRSCFSISALIRLDSFASSLRQQAIMESKVITAWAGGKKARLRRGVGLTPHTKYQIKKKKEEEGLLCAQQSDPNRLYPDTDNGAR